MDSYYYVGIQMIYMITQDSYDYNGVRWSAWLQYILRITIDV